MKTEVIQGNNLRKNDEMLMTWHAINSTSLISVTILARRLRMGTDGFRPARIRMAANIFVGFELSPVLARICMRR